MAVEAGYDGGFGRDVARGYRRVIQLIRDARDERDLYAWKGLRFEKLKGNRAHQRSMRINLQFRLIIQVENAKSGNLMIARSIEDYH
jgi:proteic killer suppression protein